MRVLVTGAAGLYGVHTVDALVKHDGVEKVFGVDDLSRHFDCPNPFIQSPELGRKFSFHEGDFRALTPDLLDQWKLDVIIHLAARTSIDESMENPDLYFTNNEEGTFRFTQSLLQTRQAPLLVYASSPEVYGCPRYVPMDEDHPMYPRSTYAVTKLAAEKHCHALYEWHGYPVIVIRNFNTYGENQDTARHAAVIPTFVRNALAHRPLEVSGDGRQTRDFTYVGDAVAAYISVLDRKDLLIGETLNVGTGRETSIADLAAIIVRMVGSSSRVVRGAPRLGDLPRLAADISRLTRKTGWHPRITLAEGLDRTIAWYRRVLPSE
ncbi:MAG: GDP-mannose 4,6-dehydratase [Bacillota bacterium]